MDDQKSFPTWGKVLKIHKSLSLKNMFDNNLDISSKFCDKVLIAAFTAPNFCVEMLGKILVFK